MKNIIASVRGMHDILPAEVPAWERLESAVKTVMHAYGYQQLRTPILEREELFTRPVGAATDIVTKELFRYIGDDGTVYCMRPEGTVATLRALAQARLLKQSQRVWYMGPMFRHERPQKGRLRQFHQFGAEFLGDANPLTDVEMISLCGRLWNELGITDKVQLQINNLGMATERSTYVAALSKYLHTHANSLAKADQVRLANNPLRVLDSKDDGTMALLANAPVLHDYLGTESRRHYEQVCAGLARAGLAYVENMHLVRGLDYYNLTVFEWIDFSAINRRQNTIAGGGRYDGLLSLLDSTTPVDAVAYPGTGMAAGMERILALLDDGNQQDSVDVFLGSTANAMAAADLALLAEKLRDASLSVTTRLQPDRIHTLFKHANTSGAKFAVIIGQQEHSRESAIVKPLREKINQIEVKQTDLPSKLVEFVAR